MRATSMRRGAKKITSRASHAAHWGTWSTKCELWGEVTGVYREDLFYHWRVGQWRAPATLFGYDVTRDGERVYVSSRLGLFALDVRDGRLRWFAVPNEECAAAASLGAPVERA